MQILGDIMEKTSGVYKIVNLINGKFYVGSSHDFKRRERDHFNLLKKNKHENDILQKSFNKYGKRSFKFEIIESIEDTDNLLEREQYYLDTLKPWDRKIGYNILKIAGNSEGYIHRESSKDKMREARIGTKHSDKTKEKMSKSRRGKKPCLGIKCKEETKIKLGLINGKKVINLYDNNKFNSATEAGKFYNIDSSSITKVCRGILKTCGGFNWQYI